jgi:TctA family transporter
MSEGSFSIFFVQPISAVLLIAGIVLFLLPLIPVFSSARLGDDH